MKSAQLSKRKERKWDEDTWHIGYTRHTITLLAMVKKNSAFVFLHNGNVCRCVCVCMPMTVVVKQRKFMNQCLANLIDLFISCHPFISSFFLYSSRKCSHFIICFMVHLIDKHRFNLCFFIKVSFHFSVNYRCTRSKLWWW